DPRELAQHEALARIDGEHAPRDALLAVARALRALDDRIFEQDAAPEEIDLTSEGALRSLAGAVVGLGADLGQDDVPGAALRCEDGACCARIAEAARLVRADLDVVDRRALAAEQAVERGDVAAVADARGAAVRQVEDVGRDGPRRDADG